jgi:spore photoproduct lyase
MDESSKLAALKTQTLFPYLNAREQRFLLFLYYAFRLTFQEFNQLTIVARDLQMWEEQPLTGWFAGRWPELYACSRWRWDSGPADERARRLARVQVLRLAGGLRHKDFFLTAVRSWFTALTTKEKDYCLSGPLSQAAAGRWRLPLHTTLLATDKKIYGLCPVAAPETLCCQLHTIDAVECCAYGCSYCIIQTFYRQEVIFDRHFTEKLQAIKIDPDRFYHFGSGQSSDSLYWGNRYGILSGLLGFARAHPNILLELKTKSTNIGYLLKHETPPNLVCSWSLNTPVIIRAEEHGTPSLAARLRAARRLAGHGIKVAFHFHPLFLYKGWEADYAGVARLVQEYFEPVQVLFISFGTLTLIKPAIRAIRRKGGNCKILQMPMACDPKGKLTYPDEIKIRLFRHLYQLFKNWHDDVYFYLCMEKAAIWQEVFHYRYASNDDFEADFGRRVMRKIKT